MRVAKWVFGLAVFAAGSAFAADDDPYLWLSDIHGEKALAWVKEQNAKSEALLKSDPRYDEYHAAILKSLDTKDRIPLGQLDHGKLYNFWQDAEHVRGLWRRASMVEYRKPAPAWEVLLDVDRLDAAEHKDWVFQGAECTKTGTRCLARLSPGGGDAAEYREFDPKTQALLADGFALSAAKGSAAYVDDDTILFATDFGPGSMTVSSYPRILKLWHRGQRVADAGTVFRSQDGRHRGAPRRLPRAGRAHQSAHHGARRARRDLLLAGIPFPARRRRHGEAAAARRRQPAGRNARQSGPDAAQRLEGRQDDLSERRAGGLPAAGVPEDAQDAKVALLAAPGAHGTIDSVAAGRDAVYASVFHDVTGSIHVFRPAKGGWRERVLALPKGGSTTAVSADDWSGEAVFTYESFLTPPTLYEDKGDGRAAAIKSQAPLFDAAGMASEQFWVTSSDGVKVPYFLIRKRGLSGKAPTILYSYGGFELALTPWYWNDGHRPLDAGQVWLSKGGAIAVANIRGGGEFGPAWHQAALRENRQKAFDDFAAVARDLETRGFTTPEHLGIVGASNGGVLTTVTMTQHPELLHAVVCQRPLIDMLRYTHFGAGASWAEEYGDPDKPQDRAYIEKYSAYQNVKPGAKYPSILFITETSDDRVTPIWARMMAAKMEAQGHDGVLFNESSEGGHGPGSTNAAQADMWALSYVYLARELELR